MPSFNVDIAPGSGVGTIYLNAVKEQGETLTDSFGNSGTLWHGSVTWGEGDAAQSVQYNGVQFGRNTWKSLGDYLDKGNWYAYGTDMLALPDTDLFYTSNLVFSADAGQHIDINLTGSVDLGVGYLEFRRKAAETDSSPAVFTIASASSEDGTAGDYLLDAAGYVIGAGVEVYLQLKGDAAHVAEWRKTGEGDLHLQGSGENTILLNLGGSGTTYLEYTGGGYAAYNVLANTGTTVVLADTGQIKRDFTFGNGGATLDLNGNSMVWNNDAAVEADDFTIHALTEDAIIANKAAGTISTLTWTQGGEQTYLGSFQDGSAAGGGESGLRFIYAPEAGDAALTWHSIHTSLTGQDSGITVNGGTLRLVGSNTVHAIASAGSWTDRLFRADDWHYADAAASVTINAGGTFELGSHARLTGDVYVKNGGTLLMREGVQQQYEYVEGWYFREDTYALADFYGLKGNVILEEGAAMRVEYSEGTTANTTYGGSLSGSGSLTVAAGDGTLSLSGDNRAFTGSKEVVSGGLIATDNKALGDASSSSGWLIREGAWLASHGFTEAAKADILTYIDTASEGVLALTSDISYLDLSRHASLVIGAWEGAEGGVHYGTANAELAPSNG